MPWVAEDAHKYNRHAVGKLADLWARVANEARERAMSHGEKKSDADARAIREANAVIARRRNFFERV